MYYNSAFLAMVISFSVYFLYTTSFVTLEEVKNYKSLQSYKYFTAGWVYSTNEMEAFHQLLSGDRKVNYSYAVSATPLHPWVYWNLLKLLYVVIVPAWQDWEKYGNHLTICILRSKLHWGKAQPSRKIILVGHCTRIIRKWLTRANTQIPVVNTVNPNNDSNEDEDGDDRTWCYCKMARGSTMQGCENLLCNIKWFYISHL